jgi:hypothetical protein
MCRALAEVVSSISEDGDREGSEVETEVTEVYEERRRDFEQEEGI